MILDGDYEIALTLFRKMYENKRCIVEALFRMIGTQPSMKSESGLRLCKNLETRNDHLRALEEIGVPTDAWDSFLFFRITENLDNESKKQGQLAHLGTDLLKRKIFVKFRDSWSRSVELGNVRKFSKAQSNNTHNSQQRRRVQSYWTVSL